MSIYHTKVHRRLGGVVGQGGGGGVKFMWCGQPLQLRFAKNCLITQVENTTIE